jgi:hypothetical protein
MGAGFLARGGYYRFVVYLLLLLALKDLGSFKPFLIDIQVDFLLTMNESDMHGFAYNVYLECCLDCGNEDGRYMFLDRIICGSFEPHFSYQLCSSFVGGIRSMELLCCSHGQLRVLYAFT